MATKKSEEKGIDKSINISHCTIGGISQNTLEAVSKLADALIANSEAIKQVAANIKGNPIETGMYITQSND